LVLVVFDQVGKFEAVEQRGDASKQLRQFGLVARFHMQIDLQIRLRLDERRQ
jgi:hypothetical protein